MTAGAIPLIEISGDARARGQQYGEAAREKIAIAIDFYRQSFARKAGLQWGEICTYAPKWLPFIERYLPESIEEIRGIAEGSNRSFEEILALNGRGELSAGNPFHESNEGCTSFAITDEGSGDGHVYCGQNWDWRTGITQTVVMLRIVQPGKPTIVMQAEAGQIGRQGANSAGIGLNANGLGGRFAKQLGIPGPYVRRKALDAWTMHDALKALFNTEQGFSTNILLTHRAGFAIDVETTPARHGWLYPTDGVIVHANHFTAFMPEQLAADYRPFTVSSLYRDQRVLRVLKKAHRAETPEAMRALIASALRDHFSHPNSVCAHADSRRHPLDETQTIASSIVDLTDGAYYLTLGNPCEREYERLPWSLYDDTTPDHAEDPGAVVASLAAFAGED